MKVKYSGLYSSLSINLHKLNFTRSFQINIWTEVPDNVAQELLKSDYFISEKDIEFENQLSKTIPDRIALVRWGAYGDLIILLPIVRVFKKRFNYNLTLVTQKCYIDAFIRETDVYDNVISMGSLDRTKYCKIMHLDGLLETDHSLTNPDRVQHRCNLLAYHFGIQINQSELDWSLHITDDDRKKARELLCFS